jgi:hypothetical protein
MAGALERAENQLTSSSPSTEANTGRALHAAPSLAGLKASVSREEL